MISFDLSSIPQDATITSATLEIRHTSLSSSPSAYNTSTSIYETDGTLFIHKVTKSWSESNLSNAQSSWSSYSSSYESTEESSFNYVANGVSWADFDVTNAVTNMHSGSIDNNGFMIITDSPRADQAASSNWWGGLWTYWISSENDKSSDRPKLTIEYTGGTANSPNLISQKFNHLSVGCLSKDKLVILGAKRGVSQISIFNTAGKTLLSVNRDLSGTSTIDLRNMSLSSGAYLIKVSNKYQSIIQKRVIR